LVGRRDENQLRKRPRNQRFLKGNFVVYHIEKFFAGPFKNMVYLVFVKLNYAVRCVLNV
jgi:hypothetical protein